MSFLRELYKDIEIYGIAKAQSSMPDGCALSLKKGDKTLISNYRPVTLLNYDYKLMSKTYSLRLMKVAPSLPFKYRFPTHFYPRI
jgi:hypothetical protein